MNNTLLLERLMIDEQFEGRTADQELIDSIDENGILEPLLVYYSNEYDRYVILDGTRRYDAALHLELFEVPITQIAEPEDINEALAIQIIVNRNRKDMRLTHVADAIAGIKRNGDKQKDIAKRFGLSEAEVSTLLTLARGHEKLRKAIDQGKITLSAAEPLLTKSAEVQEELVDAAIGQRTVRKVRALIRAHQLESDTIATQGALDEDIDPLDYLALEEIRKIAGNIDLLQSQGITSIIIAEQLLEPLETIRRSTHKMLEQTVDMFSQPTKPGGLVF